jgi:hypothetical protein
MEAYLMHGRGTSGPFLNEQVAIKTTDRPNYGRTQTGYRSKLLTDYMVKWNNKWYRVYYCVYSNIGTFYIISKNERIIVEVYN